MSGLALDERPPMSGSTPGDPFIDGDVLRRNALPHHPMNVFTSINPGRRSSADPLIDVRSRH
jgi:hypothetical protein